MISIRRLSIPNRIVAVMMIISAAALLLATGAVVAYDFIAARRDLRMSTEVFARLVADNTNAAVAFNDRTAAAETLTALRLEPSLVTACVYNREGLFAEHTRSTDVHCPPAPTAQLRIDNDLVVEVPIILREKEVGTVQLRATLEPAYARLRIEIMTLAGILVFAALFAFALSSRLHRLISTPIVSLARTANEVSRTKDHSIRATKQSEDELGDLVDAFNDMLDQLQHRETELVQANRVKDEFLATLSHELRTPLTAIFGWVDMMRNHKLDADLTTKALTVIDRNLRAQIRIVDDLLNVSRIITGNLKIEMEWIDPVALIRTAIESIRPALEAKSIKLVEHIDENAGRIYADATRLQQVLWNLLANAAKFTPSGGSVTVELTRRNNSAVLQVSDTGEGIESEFMTHVFDRFTQADSSMRRRHGGLGLGLAIVRHIVELHGGRVTAQSNGKGQGSRFTVELPIPSTPPELAQIFKSPPSIKGLRIMLVEDDPDTRDLLAATLDRHGASVIEASSGPEALQLLAIERPDVLVTDIGMPGMDGYELLSKMRADYAIPAVAVTAYAAPEDKQRSVRAGFNAHVSKPVSTEDLIAAIAMSKRSA